MAKLTLEEILKRDQGYQAMAAAMKNAPSRQGSISAYNPGFGEKAANWFNETFYGGGKMAYSPARRLETALEWSPPGIAFNSGQAIGREMNKGDVGGVARESVMAVVPGAKKGGKLVEGLVKTAGKKLTTDVAMKSARGAGKTSDELLQAALATPRKMNKGGDFMGAPPGISTPEQEQAMISDLMARLRANPNEDGFYDSSQDAIRQWTDDPQMARRFVSSSGHTSNMMSPLPNTNYAIKGMNQYAVGDDINTGMFHKAASPKVKASFDADRLSADPKTGQYSYHLLPQEHRPADFGDYAWGGERAVNPGRAVHDTWDKYAFRYPEKPTKAPDGSTKMSMPAASDPEHLFMDRAYNKLLRQARRDPELRRRMGPLSKGYERAQSSLWGTERAAAEMFDVLPFDQIMDQTSGFTQMAAIPGPSTGIVQALLNADLPTKRAYTDDMFKAISTPDGANIPARALGMSPPMREGFGPWQNMMEPNRTIDFSVATNNGGMDKAIDPSSAKAAGTMREWNQFLLGQEGSGFTTPRVDGAAAPRMKDGAPTRADLGNIASIKGVKMDSPKSFQKATNALEKIYGPNWSDAVVVQAGRNGEMLLKNITGKNNTEFQKAASEVHRMMGGVGQERMRDVGNDFRYVQFNDPSYRTLMDETRNNPVLKKTFDEKVLPHIGRLQKVSETWAKKMGVPADTVPDRVRRIFMKAGENWPQAMDEAVKKGIIPAAAATFLYGQLGTERGTQ